MKLKNVLKIFNCGYKNDFIRQNKSDVNVQNIPDEEQNEEGIELEERNLQQIDEHQDSMENPDMIDSLHVPSPDPGCPEAPMSNLMLSSVAQASNSSKTLKSEEVNPELNSMREAHEVEYPSTSTQNIELTSKSGNMKTNVFNSSRDTMPNVEC